MLMALRATHFSNLYLRANWTNAIAESLKLAVALLVGARSGRVQASARSTEAEFIVLKIGTSIFAEYINGPS